MLHLFTFDYGKHMRFFLSKKNMLIALIMINICIPLNAFSFDKDNSTWSEVIPIESFMIIDSLSGAENYYSFVDSFGFPFIRAQYIPNDKIVRLGYQLSENLSGATSISWQWRIINPPANSNEEVIGRNDSGGAVYLLFKSGAQTQIIKYVFSSTLPKGKVIKRHPLAPLYMMYIVVINTVTEDKKNKWQKECADFHSDYKKLFGSSRCPPLLGIGILSDGDQTESKVIADYADFSISGGK